MNSPIPQDFGDWFSPILVKELRQGLRTRVFTVAFISVQAILLLFTLVALRDDTDEEFVSGLFWFLLFLVLVVVTPLRGVSTLSSEAKQNTLELLSLTRLTALRICLGKWAALFTQALLFAVAVLPYVVLRYFSGGVDLLRELELLVLALTASAVLCAISVALSSLTHSISRSMLIAGFAILILTLTGPHTIRGNLPLDNAWEWTGILLLAAFLSAFSISAAASRIGSAAENYSTHRRLLTLAGFAGILIFAAGKDEDFLGFAYFLIPLAAVDALTEHSTLLPSVHRPFLRLGWAGRPLQFLFTPGWHSGVCFTCFLLALLACAGPILGFASLKDAPLKTATIHVCLAGCLLLPVLVTEMLLKSSRDRFAPYFFIQLAQAALGAFLLMLGKGGKSESLLWLGSPLPSTSLFVSLSRNYQHPKTLLIVSTLSLLAMAAALTFAGWQHLRAMSRLSGGAASAPD